MNDIYYLSHGGPGSGRYPLGSGERPYQKFEGGRGGSSGISGYIKSQKAKRNEERQRKLEVEEAEKERKLLADKDRVLREGSASEVMRYQGRLTNQELQSAFTRINLETQLRNISQKETKTTMDKIDSIMRGVKTGTEWAKIGTDTYNTFATIYNATPNGKKNPLTLVGKGDGNKKK